MMEPVSIVDASVSTRSKEHFARDNSSDRDESDDASLSPTTADPEDATNKDSSNDSVSINNNHQLARKETQAVFRLRLAVIAVLLLAAGVVSYVVYIITKNSGESEFEAQFNGAAEKVLSSFEGIISQKLGAVGSLTLTISAYAVSQNLTWPFVTVDVAFEQRAANARVLSNALHMSLLPIVTDDTRAAWEAYSVANAKWYQEGYARQKELEANDYQDDRKRTLSHSTLESTSRSCRSPQDISKRKLQQQHPNNNSVPAVDFSVGFASRIFHFTEAFEIVVEPGPGPYAPVWQSSPVTSLDAVNLNLLNFGTDKKNILTTLATGDIVLGGLQTAPPGNVTSDNLLSAWYAGLLSSFNREKVFYNGDPLSVVYFPVFAEIEGDNRTIVAVMTTHLIWASYFENILPSNAKGVVTVLENACDGEFTYEITGAHVTSLGSGDLHDSRFNYMERRASFDDLLSVADGTSNGLKINQNGCPYVIRVYPSSGMYDEYRTNLPVIVTSAVLLIFIFTAGMFVIYDRLVERRQRIVLKSAQQSSAIVSSLFPENVRDRLMKTKEVEAHEYLSPNRRLKSYLSGEHGGGPESSMEVIADLFPHCTVLFADITGFTAWSSTRDPSQVFILLQTVYQEFDAIAKRRKVFKVETIGDSYVAVTGLPNPQESHAIIMARFAWDCLIALDHVLKQLEVSLGPDTADLGMRFGMHSGAVTAGVLRGERARFQLFGDTVNTAARMESTGFCNRIQVSHTTADILTNAGKGHWLQRRDDSVIAKGKGVLNTYWLVPTKSRGTGSHAGSSESGTNAGFNQPSLGDPELAIANVCALRHRRLVDWVVESLSEKLKLILAKRSTQVPRRATGFRASNYLKYSLSEGKIALDEVAEVIDLPDFDRKFAKTKQVNHRTIQLDEVVVGQLHQYVSIIASMYRNNPFHNFEHACHVTMAVDKFLCRIVTPDLDLADSSGKIDHATLASHLHDYTHGITSDPLTLFAIVFSALIHDVDHRGVSNAQLISEEKQMATLYRNKSVAEQNSLDLAWDLLMNDSFTNLRECLFDNQQSELLRFRQVIVNVVLATDIFDKELNDLRKNRWAKAFSGSVKDNNGLKATIVIEHIIQASDVAHTMQHWHIYRKWNRRLFEEMYVAYKQGRMANDPSTFWYKGELGFFDNYIIPLAKKLRECNVFGVSSDECLNYAEQNRAEWEVRGEELLSEMLSELTRTIERRRSAS